MGEEDATLAESHRERINALSQLTESTSIVNASSEFNEFLETFIKSCTNIKLKEDGLVYEEVNPRAVDALIKSYTDRFERLKFLFLEQEAKEQFFRLVLDPDTNFIDREEILKAVEKGEELKRTLQDKKNEIDKLTDDIRIKAKTTYEYLEDIEIKKKNLLNLVDEILQDNEYLDKVYEEVSEFNSNDPSLKEFQDLKEKNPEIDFEISQMSREDLQQKLNEIKNQRRLIKHKNEVLAEARLSKITNLKNNEQKASKLVAQREKLSKLVEDIKEQENKEEDEASRSEKEKYLKKEEKLSVLFAIFEDLANISNFHYQPDKNSISFKFKELGVQECRIRLNQFEKIEDIDFPTLSVNTVEEIIEKSNESKNPALEATNLIYNSLSKDANVDLNKT